MQDPTKGSPPGFLVLQVRIGDTITIGNIILHFSERTGALLRVAIKAPKDQKIVRMPAKRDEPGQ